MSNNATSSPFPLGAYLGNPDNSSAANETTFENFYTSFTSSLGVSPKFLDVYIDQSQPVNQWVGNSEWNASSFAASPDARNTTPVIALPLNSTAAGALSPDQSFQAFASGQYDSVITGIVQAWASEGFKNLVFRPGWEMNLPGVTYAGDSAASQSDWVAAFKHVYTELHTAAAAAGVNVQVVWNPSTTNYSNAEATTNLYPGNAYVDVIGADAYADEYPYSDGGATPTYHDWATGAEDTSTAQFIANPVNRVHYWNEPAATEWSADGSGGHSQSLASLIQFAEQQGKPFAIPETGAGDSNGGQDVADDAAFPQWLAQQLTAAEATGEQIKFVNLWDSNGGGNYEFSYASDNKPAEAAAWAAGFGAQAVPGSPAPGAPAPAAPATVSIGSGSDTLALSVSEDAWQGDAQFTISVDGKQVGGVQTAAATRAAGQTQTYDVLGTFGAGQHTVSVDFLNDAYGGSSATDRNLYVNGATIDGTAVPSSSLTLLQSGSQGFSFTSPSVASPDTLDLHVSEDAWQGDAQFTIAINGKTIGGTQTATASHAAGATQDIALSGNWGANPTVGITFINDAYGGSPSTDRNLYVNGATYDGQALQGAPATLYSNGTATLAAPAGSTALSLKLAEDAWNGDAQYGVTVDGKSLVSAASVTALHGQGQSQTVDLSALLAPGTHDLAVSFLNDAYGGSSSTDRNLYVTGIGVNGAPLAGATASFYNAGTQHFQIVVPAPS